MNVMFPDMTPHGMSLYVTVSPKNNFKMIQQIYNINYIGPSHHKEEYSLHLYVGTLE